MTIVLDASAILAVIDGERGAGVLGPIIGDAVACTVNVSEVAAKLSERGHGADQIRRALEQLDLEQADLDAALALQAGLLRQATRAAGLSLGDRCCLALAAARGLPAYTSDRAWAAVDVDVEIRLIR